MGVRKAEVRREAGEVAVRRAAEAIEESGGVVAAGLFRDAMSRIGAAVHVVTTGGAAGRGGATMTAVTSVSDAPPTVLVCLNRTGRLNAIVRANGVFAINTLVAGDEPLAGVFAGVGGLDHEARFATGAWARGQTGSPVLEGARTVLECRVSEISEVGSHAVFFGVVEAVRLGAVDPALLYIDRAYRVLPHPGEGV
ncbi:MAG: flavin reductase [Siculibacillus sp.]